MIKNVKSFLRTTLFSISLFGLSIFMIPNVSALEILATNYSMTATSSRMTAQELCESANLITTDPTSGVTWSCSSANLDTTKAGRYSINIRANEGSNTELKTIQVRVKANNSNTAPVLELSQTSVTIYKDSNINLNSYVRTATDAEDGNLTPDISNNLDTSKTGVYTVTYTVTDSQGLKNSKKMTVKVISRGSESNEAETIVVDNNQTEQSQTTVENTSAVTNREELPSTGDNAVVNLSLSFIGLGALGAFLAKRKRELVD